MSLNPAIVMPGDYAVVPYQIPGTNRVYNCSVGSSISVPSEDAYILKGVGWVSAAFRLVNNSGTTANRPANPTPPYDVGKLYLDTTLGTVVLWSGPLTNHWLNCSTGGSV